MKDKKGYKRKLVETKVSDWTGKVYRTYNYIWLDGTQTTKTTISEW